MISGTQIGLEPAKIVINALGENGRISCAGVNVGFVNGWSVYWVISIDDPVFATSMLMMIDRLIPKLVKWYRDGAVVVECEVERRWVDRYKLIFIIDQFINLNSPKIHVDYKVIPYFLQFIDHELILPVLNNSSR